MWHVYVSKRLSENWFRGCSKRLCKIIRLLYRPWISDHSPVRREASSIHLLGNYQGHILLCLWKNLSWVTPLESEMRRTDIIMATSKSLLLGWLPLAKLLLLPSHTIQRIGKKPNPNLHITWKNQMSLPFQSRNCG